MKKSDFYFDLPERLIAQHPLEQRDASRLMVLDRRDGSVTHRHFRDLLEYVQPGDCMVFNNSRVIPARLMGHAVGHVTPIEVLLLTDKGDGLWECLTRPGKKTRTGVELTFGDGLLTATVEAVQPDGNRLIRFRYEGIFLEILDKLGTMPLPPYIKEKLDDPERYQTVYSKIKGSVAAPTAGLHFTPEVLAAIDAQGIGREELTLHVGAGTFKPVKSETIEGHEMHTEFISVRRSSIERIKKNLGRIIAVGRTSVRTRGSIYCMGVTLASNPDATADELIVKQWMPYEETNNRLTADEALQNILDYLDRHQADKLVTATRIIIAPGYEFKIVRGIVTNFHQPKSTLLLLISAFVKGDWKNIYDYALRHDFRFLSYGDSSLLL